MVIKYVDTNNELLVDAECNLLSCVLRLNLVDESICVLPSRDDTDVPRGMMVDTERGVIYWGIPQMTSLEANALLDHIAPIAEDIIDEYGIEIDYTEEPLDVSVQEAINEISQYIYKQDFLTT